MRIVALSDQHGILPDVPPCDLLVVAGDVCPDTMGTFGAMEYPHEQKSWFDRMVRPWLARTPATHKVLTWGNHDWCGQACSFRRDSPQEASTTDLQILVDEQTQVPADGTAPPVTIWGTPWSNEYMTWAFMKPPKELVAVYDAIPAGIDILVSHQPPFGYGDVLLPEDPSGQSQHLGSLELLSTIDRVRPRIVICGHFHAGYGRFEYHGVPIYNVAILDQWYRLTNSPTVIDLD